MRRRIRHRLEYLLVRWVLGFFSLLPAALADRVGEALGAFFFWVDGRHRRIALDNLRMAYGGEKSERQIRDIARGSYRHLGRSLSELARAVTVPAEQVAAWVRIEGWDHFCEAQKQGRGVLYLTAHLGNWELMALSQSLKGYPIGVVARPVDNLLLEDFLARLRTRWGNRVISKRGALREVLRLLKNGETIGFLLDQNVAPDQGVFVQFFGRPACTHKALAFLALKTGAVVLPAFIRRGEDGKHSITVGRPLTLEETGDLERDVLVNTQRFTRIIEEKVRECPDQWLWVHRRWKTQP